MSTTLMNYGLDTLFFFNKSKAYELIEMYGMKIKKGYKFDDEEFSYFLSTPSMPLYLNKSKTHIPVWRWGRGPTVILCHGHEGRGLQLSRFIEPLVKAGYSVVTFDMPGHGDTEKKETHYLKFLEALEVVCCEYGSDLSAVISHSLGGSAMFKYFSEHSSLKNVKLVSISATYNLIDSFMMWATKMGIRQNIFKGFIKHLGFKFGYDLSFKGPHTYLCNVENLSLIIHDKFDKTCPVENAYLFDRALSHSRLLLTENKGHIKILKDSDVINQTLSFLLK